MGRGWDASFEAVQRDAFGLTTNCLDGKTLEQSRNAHAHTVW